jgi:hypothetical protein
MRIKAIVLLTALMLGTTSGMPGPGRAEDSAMLEKLLATGSAEELESYRKLLVELEKAKLQAKDLAGATSAKLEIIKIDRQLAALEATDVKASGATGTGAANGAAAKTVTVKTPSPVKTTAEKAAAEKAAAEKAAAEKAAAEKAAAEKAAAEKAAAEKAAAEKAAAEKAAAEKAAAEKAAAEKAAAEKAAAEKAAAEKAAAELPIKAAALDKRIKELVDLGNAKLSAGDLQGAKAIKKEIAKVQAEREALGDVELAGGKDALGPEARDTKNGVAGFSATELQNYRHLLAAWELEKERSMAKPGVNRQEVLDGYRQRLIALGEALLKTSNVEGAATVKDEITTVARELEQLAKPVSTP